MPTPAKPATVLSIEGRSHRTLKEMAVRRAAEAALLTGCRIKEDPAVREDPVAHATFMRVRKLLQKIEKNDDLYHGSINRYCLLAAEAARFEKLRDDLAASLERLADDPTVDPEERVKLMTKGSNTLLGYDRQVQAKRKMMGDIEKENVMTIAASLRTVPKKQEGKKSALMEALSG